MFARRVLFTAAAVISIFSLTACSDPVSDASASDTPVATASVVTTLALGGGLDFPIYQDTSREVAEGARLFGWKRCAECHSEGGVILGAGTGNIDTIATAIRDGRPGGMPAYSGKLTDAQIWQLAAFVKAFDATHDDGANITGGVDMTSSGN